MSNKTKNIISILVAFSMLMLSTTATFAAEKNISNQDSMNKIIAKINSEYGTNIHILTKEELKKYGLPEDTNDNKVSFDPVLFEKEIKKVAEVEIPKYNSITKESILKTQNSISSKQSLNLETNVMKSQAKTNGPVTAKKAIKYAKAGVKAYIKKNNYGSNVWWNVTNVFCQSNMYQSKWFMSLNPSVSRIDAGRTLYWTGKGDYCGYVNGKQIYYSSGTQHAEFYVGNYV